MITDVFIIERVKTSRKTIDAFPNLVHTVILTFTTPDETPIK